MGNSCCQSIGRWHVTFKIKCKLLELTLAFVNHIAVDSKRKKHNDAESERKRKNDHFPHDECICNGLYAIHIEARHHNDI